MSRDIRGGIIVAPSEYLDWVDEADEVRDLGLGVGRLRLSCGVGAVEVEAEVDSGIGGLGTSWCTSLSPTYLAIGRSRTSLLPGGNMLSYFLLPSSPNGCSGSNLCLPTDCWRRLGNTFFPERPLPSCTG